MKKVVLLITFLFLTHIIIAQSVEIKDSADQILLQVNDEGENLSSVTIPNSATPPDPTTNKLYNEGGTLKWSGSALATGSSLWTLNGGNVYRSSGNVGIGTAIPEQKLHIIGTGIRIDDVGQSGIALVDPNTLNSCELSYNTSNNRFNILNLAAGSISFFTGPEAGGGSEQRLTILNNGNVGIGTPNPLSKLSVGGDGYAYSAISGIASSDLGSWAIYAEANGDEGKAVAGYANGHAGIGVLGVAECPTPNCGNWGVFGSTDSDNGWAGYFNGRVTVDGNVGIGRDNPAYKLDIDGGNILVRGDDGFISPGHTGIVHLGSVHSYIKAEYGYGVKIGAYAAADAINIKELSGNVGIGTTNPLSKLSVEGHGYFSGNVGIGIANPNQNLQVTSGTNTTRVNIQNTNTGTGIDDGLEITVGISQNAFIRNQENADLVLGTNNSDDLTIADGGNVGIGNTNPLSKLSVGGDGNSDATIFGETSESTGHGVQGEASNTGGVENYGGYFKAEGGFGRGVYGEASNTGSYVNYGGFFRANGVGGSGVYGRATAPGGTGVTGEGVTYDFYATGTGTVDYGTGSSIRWKNNIVEIDNPLDKINEIRGVYFNWDEEHGGGHDVGCIAEEVGKVLPEIVVYEENGIDADGMDYSKLTPLLVEAVKELKQIVDAQQKRIEYLENR